MKDRSIFKTTFTLDNIPAWPCPTCGNGVLTIKNEAFLFEQSQASRESEACDAWEPDWTRYVYSGLFVCSNVKCQEVVASSGLGERVEDGLNYNEFGVSDGPGYVNRFRPKYFEPHLKIFDLPFLCPKEVADPLYDSFRLFFSSPNAALNCLRSSLEEFLTDLGVATGPSLHQRIVKLPPAFDAFKEPLMAAKWLGNAGSHGEPIESNDVLDAYDLIEHLLTKHYDNREEYIATLVKGIIEARKP